MKRERDKEIDRYRNRVCVRKREREREWEKKNLPTKHSFIIFRVNSWILKTIANHTNHLVLTVLRPKFTTLPNLPEKCK